MKTNYFCPMPWISYAMRSNGYIRVCCYSNQGITSGILRRDDGTPYTYKDNINSMRNCNLLKEIRKSTAATMIEAAGMISRGK